MTISSESIVIDVQEIVKLIHAKDACQSIFLEGLIEFVSESDTFEEAKERTSRLLQFDGYNVDHMQQLFIAAANNGQVNGSFGASGISTELLKSEMQIACLPCGTVKEVS